MAHWLRERPYAIAGGNATQQQLGRAQKYKKTKYRNKDLL
jgi:hypothetical protein